MRKLLAIALLALPTALSAHPREFIFTPPAEYLSGPTQTGRTTQIVYEDIRALQRFCHENSPGAIAPPRSNRDGYVMGCYAPILDVVAVLGPKAWPSKAERRKLQVHEWAHARGWWHDAEGLTVIGPPARDKALCDVMSPPSGCVVEPVR